MWSLACSFTTYYEFLKGQIEQSEKENYILYEGEIIMSWDNGYHKLLSNYKKEYEFMNDFLKTELEFKNSSIKKYVREE